MAKLIGHQPQTEQLAEPHPMPIDALDYPRFAESPRLCGFRMIPDETPARCQRSSAFPTTAALRIEPARVRPPRIREQSAIIRPYDPVLDLDPFERLRVADYGDLSVNPISIEDTFHKITAGLAPDSEAGTVPMCVGWRSTRSCCRFCARSTLLMDPVGLIQLDAHSDTWDQILGYEVSDGTPVRRAIEEGLVAEPNILQIGLRGRLSRWRQRFGLCARAQDHDGYCGTVP